jgi:hypothetical protein
VVGNCVTFSCRDDEPSRANWGSFLSRRRQSNLITDSLLLRDVVNGRKQKNSQRTTSITLGIKIIISISGLLAEKQQSRYAVKTSSLHTHLTSSTILLLGV